MLGAASQVNVTFYGVRGSTPCSGPELARYGGNTACVVIDRAGHEPIVFDLGTGLRSWAETQPLDGSFAATALVTHLHWDHVQGLPFFPPADRIGARLNIFAPCEEGADLEEVWGEFMRPPYFPVRASDLRGDYNFARCINEELQVGDARVLARPVPHVGETTGYRVELDGTVVAYVSDHQQPDDPTSIDPAVRELCAGADLLIHDAQYTHEEFSERAHWGHCTIDYAIHVANECGVKRLALFHHDPSHDDDTMDILFEQALKSPGAGQLQELLCAREGLKISLVGPEGAAADQRG
jgi:phosphoribosyl 1,2-cyclic phosphodiesterase